VVYFTFGNSISKAIDILSVTSMEEIEVALSGLTDLIDEQRWGPSFTINVTANNAQVCSTDGDTTVSIRLSSKYGNILGLNLLADVVNTTLSFTPGPQVTSAVDSGFAECSNQGICDRYFERLH